MAGYQYVRRWGWVGLPLLLLCIQIARHAPNPTVIGFGPDGALFAYSGWQWLTAGRVPYLHLWDSKPPLTHLTGLFIAIASSGSRTAMLALAIGINVGSLFGGLLASMLAVRKLTQSRVASSIVAVSTLLTPQLFKWLFVGFRPKYAVILCVGLMLLALVEEAWLVFVGAATAAAGFWQPGAVLSIAALGTVAWYEWCGRITRSTSNRAAAVFLLVTGGAVAPFILSGAGMEMLLQTVVAPVVTSDGGGGPYAILYVATPWLFGIGALGTVTAGLSYDHSGAWYPAMLLAWFGAVIATADFDAQPDTLLVAFLLTVGIGLAFAAASPEAPPRKWTTDPRLWLGVMLAVQLYTAPELAIKSHSPTPMSELLMSGEVAPKCHVRMSGAEEFWIKTVDHTESARTCWSPAWWPG